ncbi:carbohydrate ABC transporter permease [Paenibacillus contaminans]|uniref:Sugar ABC transporter permease n=1 Tax=Paenibacillus contaminans TaxID=450362 RepID=A0A329MLK8_9BACL|nr:sugar ABC transporter permease [Paenibacillus contaminans]RAV20664.1 sugar ABC transporter permease [Paenibacillus contaminans]
MSEAALDSQTAKKVIADKKESLWARLVSHRTSFLFLAPFFLLFLVFTVIPVLTAAGLSLTYYNILEPPRWVGLENYKQLFLEDDIFLKAIGNTLTFAVFTGPLGYCMSFILAWLISNIPQKYRFFFTLCFYTPAIASSVAMSVVWLYLFSGDRYGLINHWMIKIGVFDEPWLWLQDVKTIMPVIILVSLWTSMGTGFLAFLAGLSNVPTDLYEAGVIDGVRYRWQELWYITLPSIKPQLLFGAVLTIVSSLQVYDIAMSLAGFPSTLYAGHTIMTHLYDYAFVRFEMGYAAAIAVVLFLLMVGLNRIIFNLLGERD